MQFCRCPWFGAWGRQKSACCLANVREDDPLLLLDGGYPVAFCCGRQRYE
ncbi:hypothetical protein [Bartonella sp. AU55XJBT]|nr:hypothetical protein [Bartonella sp. AU55XJBT]